MRIRSAQVCAVEMEMPGKLRNARRRWTRKQMLFVFLEGDDGLLGIGEGWTSYASPRALQATIEDEILPLVIGADTAEAPQILEQARQSCAMSGRYGITAVAVSAVEIAMWDLAAKAAGQPLFRFLGGNDNRVPVYGSAGLYHETDDRNALGRELAGYIAQGFTAVKMKIGGATLEEDVARVAAARAALGPEPVLTVDAHYTLDLDSALRFAERAAEHNLAWLEAPLMPTDYAGTAKLAAASAIPICGNETLPWRDPFFELMARDALAFVMPDLSACGGVLETRAVAQEAARRGLMTTLHSSSSVVLFAASLHVAASLPRLHSVEYHMMHRWFYDLAPAWLHRVEDGLVSLGEEPGIGIALTPEDLAAARAAA